MTVIPHIVLHCKNSNEAVLSIVILDVTYVYIIHLIIMLGKDLFLKQLMWIPWTSVILEYLLNFILFLKDESQKQMMVKMI